MSMLSTTATCACVKPVSEALSLMVITSVSALFRKANCSCGSECCWTTPTGRSVGQGSTEDHTSPDIHIFHPSTHLAQGPLLLRAELAKVLLLLAPEGVGQLLDLERQRPLQVPPHLVELGVWVDASFRVWWCGVLRRGQGAPPRNIRPLIA